MSELSMKQAAGQNNIPALWPAPERPAKADNQLS
jgi:hypothetical protein